MIDNGNDDGSNNQTSTDSLGGAKTAVLAASTSLPDSVPIIKG